MKTNLVNKIFEKICFFALLFIAFSCIEETFPTSGATEDQLNASKLATEARVNGIPASLNVLGVVSSDYHWDWGYGSIMHIRDVMTEDMAVISSGYDWYSPWEENTLLGESYVYAQFIWNYYWQSVLTTNKVIGTINYENATDEQKGYLAVAHAFRAFFYLDMARMYEFLPSDKIPSGINDAGNDVTGLTVPIVREDITEEQSRKNPRVSREKMAEFILEDLTFAEENIEYYRETKKTMPHLDVIYGLKARCYLWLEDYQNAKDYARKAIDNTTVSPMTENQCLNTTSGFNDISCWMWGSQLVAEDNLVKTGILNWASWMSNETSFGYSAQQPYLMIGASLYDRISDTDFRKKLWKAPSGTTLDGETDFITSAYYGDFGNSLTTYASVKFRPGSGNPDDYTVGAVTAYPLMRVEEMFFIEAEAAAQLGDPQAANLLTSYMSTYRDPYYICRKSGEDLIDEIIFQKRIELWGEGLTFFDVKRLNMSVTRGYEGTNFSSTACFNTTGRPAWMNICIVQSEKNNNSELIGYENPDPSKAYETWIAEEK